MLETPGFGVKIKTSLKNHNLVSIYINLLNDSYLETQGTQNLGGHFFGIILGGSFSGDRGPGVLVFMGQMLNPCWFIGMNL